jgi:hypothetical protein
MSDLTALEKRKFELLFGMGGGYVLDFSNRTFEEFILDVTGKEIFTPAYEYASGSKANRLRAFWKVEPNNVVGLLMSAMLDLYKDMGHELNDVYHECRKIAERLLADSPVLDIEALVPNADGRDFYLLAKSVRDAIEANQPEAGIDRLHTFVIKYIRVLCENRGIAVDKDKPLHSAFGEYVKSLREAGLIESEMAERILKSTISIFEAFNRVRNDQSLAHDNPTLSYPESIFIFSSVASTIKFLQSIERKATAPKVQPPPADDDLPF